MNTLKKNWMNFKHSSLSYQTIKKNVLGYFQVNSEILETRISSSSKFVPQKNSSSIFKFEPEKIQEVQVFLYQVISSLLPSLHSSHMYICTYVPTYLPIPNFCYSTTGHDHDRPGALRPMHASPTQPHTYKLPAASVPGHLWSFSTVRQNQLQSPPPEKIM